ncbi:hypothetical protein FNV43_RR05700 [Rhamnella rubrinervis]|uniref:Uncharacterized protein n=1 Tax=Rhamnella rubrinervis TaxID=2594499 RepID=A0A8K0HLU7_9ROSA|nr:hypothetical protein FNV43_RR05700 [Rhamnella rubrinervis]
MVLGYEGFKVLVDEVLSEEVDEVVPDEVEEVDNVEMESMKVYKAFKYPTAADAHVRITNKAVLGKVLDDVKKKMGTVVKNYHVVSILEASLGEENILTISEHGHDEHYDDFGHDIVESPLKRFEVASSRQVSEDTQKYIIPPSTQDENEVVKIVHTEEEVNNNEDVNKEESINKMDDTHTIDTINKMEDMHIVDTVNKMEETHIVHMEEETHTVHIEEETHIVPEPKDGELDIGILGYKRLRRKARNVKSPYTVNEDLKKRLKNALPADQFNPMKPAAEGMIQAFAIYLLKDLPKVILLGEYEPISLEFMQVMTKTTAWLTDERTACPDALNVMEANHFILDEVPRSTSSVVCPKQIVLHDVLRLRFMSQTKLDEVLDQAFRLLHLRFMSQR